MAATLGCQFHELAKKIANAQDPETVRISQRHQNVIEARAKLHAEAGVQFYKRFSRFKDHEGVHTCHDVLIYPRVTCQSCHVAPAWSFSGGSRLVVELDPNAAAANKLQEAASEPSYVSFIKGSWQPLMPNELPDHLRRNETGSLQFWQETGLAEVHNSSDPGPHPYGYRHPARKYHSLFVNQAASAPYAMYRMLCLFPWLISEWRPCDYYKCLWFFTVEHKQTGFIFQMSEHKGALHAVIEWNSDSPWADCFKGEACLLLELLLSDACRHPCGVLAGSIDPSVLSAYKESQTKFDRYVVDPIYAGPVGVSQEDCDNIVRVRERWRTIPEPDTSERSYRESLMITVGPPFGKVCVRELEEEIRKLPERGISEKAFLTSENEDNMVPLCAAISSGLLLYRLISIFTHDMTVGFELAPNRSLTDLPKFVKPPNPTNSLWHTEIAHVATGHVVRFGEFRGAATAWSVSGMDSLKTETELEAVNEDLKWLLALICGQCPHTYDGILAGCHA